MNPRACIYLLASFCLTIAAGVREGLTPAGWISLVTFALGSALNAGLAYLDRGAGDPPAPPTRGRNIIALIAILIALALAGCVTLDVSTKLPSGTTIRAGTNGTGARIELSREF